MPLVCMYAYVWPSSPCSFRTKVPFVCSLDWSADRMPSRQQWFRAIKSHNDQLFSLLSAPSTTTKRDGAIIFAFFFGSRLTHRRPGVLPANKKNNGILATPSNVVPIALCDRIPSPFTYIQQHNLHPISPLSHARLLRVTRRVQQQSRTAAGSCL